MAKHALLGHPGTKGRPEEVIFVLRVSGGLKWTVLQGRLWQALLGSTSPKLEYLKQRYQESDLHGLDGIVGLLNTIDFDKFCGMG